MVTIDGLLKEGTEKLVRANIASARLDAEVILYNLLNRDRIYLYMYREKEVDKQVEEDFWTGIEKRLNHMPVQYIVNKQEFMGLDFYVEEGILIPRPDTEILVEKVMDIYKNTYYNKQVRLMDIGTGSGAIAVSLAKYIDKCIVTAVDISPKALDIALKNASANRLDEKIKFCLSNLFDGLGQDEYKTYDFIISNPPYIPRDEVDKLDSNVKNYEPHLALDGGEDGLDFYRKITRGAKDYLKDRAWLLFEIGHDQGRDVSKILNINGYKNIFTLKDLAGLDRVVGGHT